MRKILFGVVGALLVFVLLAGWQLGLFTAEPEAANLADSVAAELDATTTTATPADEAEATTTATVASVSDAPCTFAFTDPAPESAELTSRDDLTGTWVVRRSDASFAGYRIDEILSGVDFTAVGRTTTISGSVVADAEQITEATIAVDMVGLTSDSRIRDEQMKSQALETRDFPVACFTLTEPLAVPDLPEATSQLAVEATGELYIHGVTQLVDVPIEATTTEGLLFVVGSAEVALADFNIETPSAPAVAGVSETATFEFSLVLSR